MRLPRARLLYSALHLAERLGRTRTQTSAAIPERRPFGPGISVIIPERANPAILSECLDRARVACRALSEPSEVIVVVNGTPPSQYRRHGQNHTDVRWVYSKKPLWYSGAIRRGLASARYDWVYLLSSDTLLEAQALESLLSWRGPRVFSIASQVFFRDPAQRREETGWTQYRNSNGPIEILDAVPDDDTTVRGTFYAGGGAGLFRRYLLQKLARAATGYDPFYWEDVEWGVRAWRMGYHNLYCPASRACHLHRSTNRLFFSDREIDRILARNRFVFHFRNGPPAASFQALLQTLTPLDDTSVREIFTLRRIAQMARGHFQSCRLPSDHIALAQTWRLRVAQALPCNRAFQPFEGRPCYTGEMAQVTDHKFSATLDCHYLLQAPDELTGQTPLIVTLHGFGMNPEIMLPLTARLFDIMPVIVSLQGPYPFFLPTPQRDVGYGWVTSRHSAESVRLHHDMVSHVLEEVGREFAIPPARRVLVGFSQPVGLNYRFAATCPEAVRGVIGICGGLPGDWDTGSYQPVRAALLHIARRQDEYYKPETTEPYTERLRRRAADVEFHLIEGGHQMPSDGRRYV